jgi:hypothetical protein
MKSNFLITIGMLILLSVIVTAFGIWYLSKTAEFSRKDQPAPITTQP